MPNASDLVKQVIDGNLLDARDILKDIVNDKVTEIDTDAYKTVVTDEKREEN